jgi:hypothetical protein
VFASSIRSEIHGEVNDPTHSVDVFPVQDDVHRQRQPRRRNGLRRSEFGGVYPRPGDQAGRFGVRVLDRELDVVDSASGKLTRALRGQADTAGHQVDIRAEPAGVLNEIGQIRAS